MKSIISAPEKLNRNHIVEHFDCGNPELNIWLQRFAFQNQKANAAITFVACLKKKVIAYYSLAVGSIEHQHATPRVKKGLARHSIPVMIIARLAVDIKFQGQKIGKGLLKDAILKTQYYVHFLFPKNFIYLFLDINIMIYYDKNF